MSDNRTQSVRLPAWSRDAILLIHDHATNVMQVNTIVKHGVEQHRRILSAAWFRH